MTPVLNPALIHRLDQGNQEAQLPIAAKNERGAHLISFHGDGAARQHGMG